MLIILVSILLYLAPSICFIKFMHLPVNHLEFFYFILTLLAASLVTAFTLWRAGWMRLTLLLPFWVVFSFSFLPEFQSKMSLLLCWFFMMIITMLLGEKTLKLLFVVMSIFSVSLLLFPLGHQFEKVSIESRKIISKQNLSPFIYIIFDEHAGINNVAADPKTAKTMKNFLEQFYQKYDFTLYTHSYSRYSRTYDSIPNLLNFTTEAQDNYYFQDNPQQILSKNQLFKLLSKQGYQLRVYQSDYMNFCRVKDVNYTYCYTYPVFSFYYFYQLPLSWQQRYAFILKSYLYLSGVFQYLMYNYSYHLQPALRALHLPAPSWGWTQNEMSTLATLLPLAQLQTDVLQHAHDGSAFFAHILLPHSPYIYNANCQPNLKPMTWLVNYDYGSISNTPASRAQRYQLYQQQMYCLYKQLQPIFDSWQQAGVLQNATIIVQGDHGARLPLVDPVIENKGKFSQQDIWDSYPALFAVKQPGKAGSLNDQWLPITYLLGNLLQQLTRQSFKIDNTNPYVFLTGAEPHTNVMQPTVKIGP